MGHTHLICLQLDLERDDVYVPMELERLSPGTDQVGNVFQKISVLPVSSSPTTNAKIYDLGGGGSCLTSRVRS